jgi:hypothetical protein
MASLLDIENNIKNFFNTAASYAPQVVQAVTNPISYAASKVAQIPQVKSAISQTPAASLLQGNLPQFQQRIMQNPTIKTLATPRAPTQDIANNVLMNFFPVGATENVGSKIVNTAGKVKLGQAVDTAINGIKKVGPIDTFFNRTRNVIASQGQAGQELAQRLQGARDIAQVQAGKWLNQMPTVRSLNPQEFTNFVDVAENKAKPISDKVNQAFNEWNGVRNDVYGMAKDAGVMIGKQEDYFPHTYDPKMFEGDNFVKMVNHLVQSGQSQTPEEAVQLMRNISDIARNRRQGNLEISRLADLPGYEKTKTALLNYVEGAARRIGQVQQLGQQDSVAMNLIHQIGQQGGDAQAVKEAFDVASGAKRYSQTDQGISRALRSLQSTTKLGFGAITNAGHSVNTAVTTGIFRTLASVPGAIFDPAIKDFALKSGVTLDGVVQDLREGAGFSGKVLSKITAPGFNSVEKFNRTVAAWAGKGYAEDLAKQAVSGSQNAINQLQKMGLNVQDILNQGGQLTEGQQIRAARSIVERTQFLVDPQDLPGWASSPYGKLFAQFKNFSYNQTAFVKREILDPARQGNFSPLINFLVVGSLIGESVADVKAFVRARNRPQGTAQRAADNLNTVGGAGIVQDAYNAASRGPQGVLSFLGGPTAGEVSNLVGGAGLALQGKPKTLGKTLLSDVPIVGQTISNKVFPPQNAYQSRTPDLPLEQASAADSNPVATPVGIPPGAQYVNSKDAPQNLLTKALTYGSGLIQDPTDTFNALTSGQPVRKVVGGQTIVERQQGLASLDHGNTTTQVDHKIALELGGTNDPSNLQVISTYDNQLKGQVENYLVAQLKAGKITRQQAQQRDLNWKNEVDNLPQSYLDKIKTTTAISKAEPIVSQPSLTPLEQQQVKSKIAALNTQIKQITNSGDAVTLPLLGQVSGLSETQKNQQLNQLEAQKLSLQAQIKQTSPTALINAQTALDLERAKRANDSQAYVQSLQKQIDYLGQYESSLNPDTQQVTRLQTQKKIEDLTASKNKILSQGGLTKGKKAKKPRKISIKIVRARAPRTNIKSFKLKAPKLKLAKTPTYKVKGFKVAKFPSYKIKSYKNTLSA